MGNVDGKLTLLFSSDVLSGLTKVSIRLHTTDYPTMLLLDVLLWNIRHHVFPRVRDTSQTETFLADN